MLDRETSRPTYVNPCEEKPLPSNGNNGQKLVPLAQTARASGCCGTCGQDMKAMAEKLEEIKQNMAVQREQLAGFQVELGQLTLERQMFTHMQEQNRQYAEQFYEREFLSPFFLTLIGIADRCREQATRLRRAMAATAQSRDVEMSLLLKSLIESREGDRIEIEEMLANHSVESFQNCSGKYDASVQKCIRQECTEDPRQHGIIARRLAPGYRRNGRILRQEHVSVFVQKQST